jgi:hypothetical protein
MSDQLLNRTGTPFPSENEKLSTTPNRFSSEDTGIMYLSAKEMRRIRNALLTDKAIYDDIKEDQESSELSNLIDKIAPYSDGATIQKTVGSAKDSKEE